MTKQDEYLIAAEIADEFIAAMYRVPEPNDSSAPEYARHARGALDNALEFVRMWRDQIEQSLTSSRRALASTPPDTEGGT